MDNARVKGFVLGLALFVLGAWGRAEESPLPLFEQGNVAYQKGDFVAARDLYEKTVAEGWGGAALFYNLGNTYFRLGQWGRARLWYERAWREDRRDEDIRYNRDLVRRQVGDMEEGTDRVIGWSGALWGVTGLVQLIFFGGLMWGLFRESELLWWTRWMGGLALSVLLPLSWGVSRRAQTPWGVVVSPRVEARTGPDAGDRVGFLVPEGQRVVLMGSAAGWVQIGVPEKSLKGWVPRESVEPVGVPSQPTDL